MSTDPTWEERVSELASLLRDEDAPPAEGVPASVMRSARWQHTARGGLLAISHVVGAAAHGAAMVLGKRR